MLPGFLEHGPTAALVPYIARQIKEMNFSSGESWSSLKISKQHDPYLGGLRDIASPTRQLAQTWLCTVWGGGITMHRSHPVQDFRDTLANRTV